MKLLCLSNGHGEDSIAVAILRELLGQEHPQPSAQPSVSQTDSLDSQADSQLDSLPNSLPQMTIAALPIVGEGHAYAQLPEVTIAGPVKAMPSGGFNYMDGRQFWRDVRGGLLGLTWTQIRTVRSWAQTFRREGAIVLAVGDIVPLTLAWLSGAPFAFVGTAKSEYYLRDEIGTIPRPGLADWLERLSGSVYLPWERAMLRSPRCLAVFPRDTLTAKTLEKFRLPVFDLGNPMMDHLDPSPQCRGAIAGRALTILLLPGSRSAEAVRNWEQILHAIAPIRETFADRSLCLIAALSPGLERADFTLAIERYGWRLTHQTQTWLNDPHAQTFTLANAQLVISQQAFADCLHRADLALAMAGTATEQFVGLGKPVITFPGTGPQFTPAFAEAQGRLLGSSVIRVDRPEAAVKSIERLLQSPDWVQAIAENGRRRLGEPGAADRIAQCLKQLVKPPF